MIPAKHTTGHGDPYDGLAAWWQCGRRVFIYHLDNNQVYVGFVVHLNYENPYLYPYMEFQRFKHHPMVAELFEGRQTRGLRRARDHRRRLAEPAETGGAGCGVAGLCGGYGQRAAHQGQP